MKRLVLKLLCFAPMGALLVWINWQVDPAHFFRLEGEDDLNWQQVRAELQSQGFARTDGPVDQRRLFGMAFSEKKRDVVCYGTSVAKPIPGTLFPHQTFFNAAVTASRLETMIAVDQLFLEHGARANSIILVVDPWCLTSPSRNAPGFEDELVRALQRMQLVDPETDRGTDVGTNRLGIFGRSKGELAFVAEKGFLHPYDKLISVRYFQLSLRAAMQRGLAVASARSKAAASKPASERPSKWTLFRDGSIDWSDEMRQRTTDDIRRRYSSFVYSADRARELRMVRQRFDDLRTFVEHLLAAGCRVEIWLPPVSPWYFDSVPKILSREDLPNYFVETEGRLRSLATTLPVTVRGSYDPARSGARDQDFIDPYHMRREAMLRVWTARAD